MNRNVPVTVLLGLWALTACQPAGTGVTPPIASSVPVGVPSQGPASPTPMASSSAIPVPDSGATLSASLTGKRELVLGAIYDDEGAQIEGATVAVACDLDSTLNKTIQSPGSYSFRAPVGSTVTVTVSKDGYAPRTRVHKVVASNEDDPNRLDFGGKEGGVLYALTSYTEISAISPSNLQKGVLSNPLVVKFTFSQPLTADSRDRFSHLFQIRVPSPDGDQIVSTGSVFNNQRATLSWDEVGRNATFTFPAPIVAHRGESAAIAVSFDPAVSISSWPLGKNGKRLGRDKVSKAVSGTGAETPNRLAPILRDTFPVAAPSTRPSPLDLWGLTHWTDISFTLAQDESPLKLVSTHALPGNGSTDDLIEVEFNKPLRGFPESALDGSALKRENYVVAVGRNDSPGEAAAYADADPAKGGGGPSSLEYDAKRLNVINLHFSPGSLSKFSRYKLYVAPAVKDIYGTPVQTSAQDPKTHLSDNVIEGLI